MASLLAVVATLAVGALPAGGQAGANPTLRPWTSTTQLPEPRSRLGAVAANGFVYALGGLGPSGAGATNTSYVAPVNADGTVGAWSTTTPLPGPRRTVRPAIWNGRIYVAGGNDGNAFQSTVYVAPLNPDGTIGAWTATTPLPGPLTAHSTLAVNGFLYVVGGNTGTTCIPTVRFAPVNPDGTLGAWQTTSSLPAARCGNVEAVTVANGFMYAAGGFDNADVTRAVYYAPINANGTLGTWVTNPNSLTVAREYNGLEAVNGFLYAIGGQDDVSGFGGATDVVEVAALNADGSVGPFAPTTSLPGDRGDLATEAIAGRVYAIGGGLGASGADPQPSVFFSSQAPVDPVPPVVSLTSPAAGEVSGTIEVTATATDDVGVVGVQFLLDGNPLGAEDTTAPYSITWDTTTAANGPHTLAARARDAANNQTTSAPVTVTVANNPSASQLATYGMEAGSGTVLADSSGNGNHAALTAGTWTTAGRYGNAVVFDGVATRARTTTTVTLGNAWTLQAWVNNPTNQSYETLLTVGADRDLYLENGQLTFYGGNIGAVFGQVPTGSWQHVALTYDGTTLRAYLNGNPLGGPQPATLAPVTAPLQLGAWIFGADNVDYFSGTLDEIRVANRALSAAELQADAATPVQPPSTPDPEPPAVTLTAPAEGEVSGTIEVTATATDDVGVVGVQFLLDGNPLGAEDTTAPYSITWDTTTAANGPHTLAARARDAAGNQTTSAAVEVTVANNPATSLVVAYGLEAGSGTVLADSSGNGNHAALTAGTWTTAGRYGNAVTFNGTTTRARTANNITLGSAWTLQAWVNNPTNQSYETLLTVGPNRDLYLENGELTFYGGNIVVGFGQVPTGSWQHVALTYDGTTLRAYLNGTPLGQSPTVAIPPATGPLQVGAWIFGTDNVDFFSGTLDEIRITNRALSAAELQADAATPVQPTSPEGPAPTTTTTTTTTTTSPTTTTPGPTTTTTPAPTTTTVPAPGAGLLVAYGFEEAVGTTTASTPAGPVGTLTSASWATGRYGTGLAFDGIDTRVRTTTAVSLGSAFTMEAWVLNPSAEPFETIMTVGTDRNLFLRNGELRFDFDTSSVGFGVTLPATTWVHVAVTYDGTALRAYVDGVAVGTPQAVALGPVTGPLQVGAWIFGGGNADYFSGLLDEVRVYDRALTAAEIQADRATPILGGE